MSEPWPFDIGPDHRDADGKPLGSWYVVDMRTFAPLNAYGITPCRIVAGPFPAGKPSAAAHMRDWLNLPWWRRAVTPCPNTYSLYHSTAIKDFWKQRLRWTAFR